MSNLDLMPYRVGGLLYTPALNSTIAEKIITQRFPALTSVALCLEDSVTEESLAQAERVIRSGFPRK